METIKNGLKEIFKDSDIDGSWLYEDGMTFNEFNEALLCNIDNQEIIYYSTAMDYLKENDFSLREAMRIASDLGIETKDLNSELLATLVYQENLREELGELYNEIEDLFDNNETDA